MNADFQPLPPRGPPTRSWLPAGKSAAVVFSIDDIHPGTSDDAYEAGGDRAAGALGRVARLGARHPQLKTTLCVTPDWRLRSLVPDHPLRHVPGFNRRLPWTRLHPVGHFSVDRHPQFVSYLNGLHGCEVVVHGLHHAHRGPRFATEFQDQGEAECRRMVLQGMDIFRRAGLRFVSGYVPPAWNAPPALLRALGGLGFTFFASARDVRTMVTPDAVTAHSGYRDVSLIHPQRIGADGLVHFTANFQATSPVERALDILEAGGLLHIKAHIFKSDGHHVMLDGLDDLYCNYLDALLNVVERLGERIWWPHLSEVAARVRGLP